MQKPRLRRLDWVYRASPLFFVTACTHARGRWLDCVDIHQCFVDFCGRATKRGALVGRYVLVPDHFHLFVAFRAGELTLSGWMKSLKNALSKTLRAIGKPAPHWQDGFFDHVLRSSESHEQKRVYVRDNPVRAGLVRRAEDWPYQGEIHLLQLQRRSMTGGLLIHHFRRS
jgi:putative transposase